MLLLLQYKDIDEEDNSAKSTDIRNLMLKLHVLPTWEAWQVQILRETKRIVQLIHYIVLKITNKEKNVLYLQPYRLGTPSSQGGSLGGEAPDTGDSHPSDTEAASSLLN